jgi:hypothetical protein
MGGGYAYGAMPRKVVQVILIYKGFSYLCGSAFVIGGLHISWVYLSSLGTGIFKGTVGSVFEGFPFFLLLSLHNLLYTFLYTLVSSCSPSTKALLRRFRYLIFPSKSRFLSKSQPSSLACRVPRSLLWPSITIFYSFTKLQMEFDFFDWWYNFEI